MPDLFDRCSEYYPTWYSYVNTGGLVVLKHARNLGTDTWLYSQPGCPNEFVVRQGRRIVQIFGLNRAEYVFKCATVGDLSFFDKTDTYLAAVRALLPVHPPTDAERKDRYDRRNQHIESQRGFYKRS